MGYPVRTIAGALASVALVLAVGACSDAPTPTQPIAPGDALAKNTTDKFTFEDVTLVDGDLTFENAIIESGVRDHKNDKNDWTNCSYFTEDYEEHLGTFGAGLVPGDGGAETVREFCSDNFENRE